MNNSACKTTLPALAESVAALSQAIASHFEQTGTTPPDFTPASTEIPSSAEYERLRIEFNNVARDLIRLVNGPKIELRDFITKHYEFAAWQVALEFDYFTLVPLDGSISVQDLAAKAGMDEVRTLQVMRYLATQRVFTELPGKDEDNFIFKHTAASATIAREPLLKDAALMQADEMFRASSSNMDAIKASPFKIKPDGGPFTMRHGEMTYKWYEKHPDHAARFARAMKGVTLLDRQTTELSNEYDWASLPKGKIVDVGGGSGHVSRSLAEAFPHLDFVIQDVSPTMLAQGPPLWEGLSSRVQFQEYDFFQPQPINDAVAYFSRQITHNLTNEDVVRFFKSFVPALESNKPGTPMLINDTVIPEPGEKSRYEEYGLRQMDLAMWICFNSKQRTAGEFRRLLTEADPRLKLVKVHSKGSMGLLEVHLQH